jgi:hypothetical protein
VQVLSYFKFFSAVTVKIIPSCEVTPYSLAVIYQNFWGSCCHHLQGISVKRAGRGGEERRGIGAMSTSQSATMKKEETRFSDTFVHTYQTAWGPLPKDSIPH